ncbi:MAG: hypothetical protein V8R67_04245 [Eubacterium sp.]
MYCSILTISPAACDCILNNFKDFGVEPDYYDKIITGDSRNDRTADFKGYAAGLRI